MPRPGVPSGGEHERSVTVSSHTYSVILEPAEEGGFVVRVPALPEVVTEGDTVEDALANAREAIELVLEHRAERGQLIPDGDAPFVHQIKVSLPVAA